MVYYVLCYPRFYGQGMGFPTLNTNSFLDRLPELCKIR
jgi:hypothetical protein